jgi:hypothetical protein
MSVQTLEPTKQHYTNVSAPAVVQTLSGQVHTNQTQLHAFHGFTLPAKPAGETLTGAQLRVTATTTGGSVDTITYSTCSDSWDEATLCWNNQPADGTLLGSLVAPNTVSIQYFVTLTPLAPLIAAAGGPISLSSNSNGTDAFVIWQRANATASNRTNLILTFTPDVSLVTDFAGLRAAGYTGSLSDMRRQNLLALLGLTEPQLKTNNDLELQYRRSIGKTGSILDMRKQ